MAIFEKVKKIINEENSKKRFFNIKYFENFFLVNTKKYNNKKNPAIEFGWENVP